MRKVAWRDPPAEGPVQEPERQERRIAWKEPKLELDPAASRNGPEPAQTAAAGPVQTAEAEPAQTAAAEPVRELQEPAWINGEPEPRERKVAWKDPVRKKPRKSGRSTAEPEDHERRIAWKEPAGSGKDSAGKQTDRSGRASAGAKKKAPRSGKKRRQHLLIAGIIFAVIAIAGLSVFVRELSAYHKSAVYYERLSEFTERELQDAGNGENSDASGRTRQVRGSRLDFSNLRRINPDVAAWLSMPQISFSGPVVWCGNNTTYLDKGFDWTPSRNGCLFLAAEAASDFSLPYSLIYGRNMHNGTMFGRLDRYRKKSFFEKNPTFLIYTPRQDYECAVFSCYRTEDASEVYRMDWKDAGEYSAFLERIKAASAYDTGVNVFPGDKVLTLSTCGSSYTGGKDRFVVHAVMRRIE